jgi:membrane-associated phospholipid phosphatase
MIRRLRWMLPSVLLMVGHTCAEPIRQWGKTSDVLAASLPLAAGLVTLGQHDAEGVQQLVMAAGSSLFVAEILKSSIHSKRPDGSDNKSFPSAHTALAFSAAAFFDQRYGQQQPQWTPALYGLAALTGIARVEAHKHRWVDVVAGAAIGYGTALFWSQPVQGGRLSVIPAPHGWSMAWARTF